MTFKATVPGAYTLRLTSDDPAAQCGVATDDVIITVTPEATVDAGGDRTVCPGTITLTGTSFGGGASGATWSIVSQPTTPTAGNGVLSNTTETTTPATVTFTATVPGKYTLRLTTNDPAGTCVAVSDDVDITIDPGFFAQAGGDQTICRGDTYTFTGALVGGGAATGAWTIVSQPTLPTPGDGVLSSTAQTSTPDAVTFTATVPGTYTIRLTTDTPTSGSCPAGTDDIIITVIGPAVADAGTDKPICSGELLTLSEGAISGGATTGAWSIVSQPAGPPVGDGVLSSTAQTNNPAAVTFTATIPGKYILRLTTNDPAGSCVADSDEMEVTVNNGATADVGTNPLDLCPGDVLPLSGATIGGAAATGAWSIVSQPTAPTPGDGALSSTAQTAFPGT